MVLEEKRADRDEWYARQDSIFDIEYPDGPRPFISDYWEFIAYHEARHVVENLDRQIANLRDDLEALEAGIWR